MLFLAIVGLIATRAFYKTASKNGLHPGKAAGTPIIGLMLILAANHLILQIVLAALKRWTVSDSIESWVVFINGVFVIITYLVFLRENHKALEII